MFWNLNCHQNSRMPPGPTQDESLILHKVSAYGRIENLPEMKMKVYYESIEDSGLTILKRHFFFNEDEYEKRKNRVLLVK